MKKLLFPIVVLSFVLFSCGGTSEQNNESSDEAGTEQTTDETDDISSDDAKTCDEFLDNFEKWTDDYLDVVEAYMKDPTNIEISQEYAAVAESAGTWSQEWVNYVSCAQTEKYSKRYDEISEKVDKRMKELGLQD